MAAFLFYSAGRLKFAYGIGVNSNVPFIGTELFFGMNDTIKVLLKEGSYITTIDYNQFKISLYSLSTEFYEVVYNQTERIVKISQASDNDLGKYLSMIDLLLG